MFEGWIQSALLHEDAFTLQFLLALLRPGLLGVQLQTHGPLLLHVEQLLKELLDVAVGLGRRLHEGASPSLGLVQSGRVVHLASLGFVTLVADEHHRNAFQIALDLVDDGPDRTQFLQRLLAGDRVDQDERVALRYAQSLHRRKLMAARRVRDLQRTDVLVAADHLPVRVLDGRYVALAECASDEAQDQRTLADAAGSEHHHPIIVALFGHTFSPEKKTGNVPSHFAFCSAPSEITSLFTLEMNPKVRYGTSSLPLGNFGDCTQTHTHSHSPVNVHR